MQVTANKNIVSSFVNAWILYAVSKSILHIKASTFNILPKLGYLEIEGFHNIDNIQDNVTYDFIFGDFPIGLKRGELNYDSKSINVRENWLAILKSLKSLNKNGSALFLLEATGFGNVEGRIFEKALNESGYFVNAYFNLPEKILFPQTGCRVLLGYISRNKTEKTFVAELIDETQAQDVAKSCLQHINQNNLTNGKYIDSGCFTGFNQLIIREKIAQLETQYKNYKEFSLGEISTRIYYVKSGEQLQECNNAIYIPKIGNSKVICNLEDAKLKHHNYFQVVLGDLALNEYVMSFFRSTLGKLVLDSLVSGTFIPHLNKKDIEQALVALPTIDEQKNICNTQKKLHHLKNAMDEFDAELALNPSGSISILNQLDMMSHAIGQLTDVDTIHRLLREGESKYVEFKETLSLDVKKQT